MPDSKAFTRLNPHAPRRALRHPGGLALLCALLISALLMGATPASAEDGIVTIEGARIRGDQESPTVLYLVPWQPPIAQSLQQPGGSFMVERAIEPLDRAQFQRVLSYHRQFKALNSAGAEAPEAREPAVLSPSPSP